MTYIMGNCGSSGLRHQTGPDYVHATDVYVTNQCNLGCLSCFVDTVKSQRGSVRLQWEDFKNAIDTFMNPDDTPPLLNTAKYIQKFEKPPYVYIHTNGTNMHLHDVSRVFLKGLLKTAARLRHHPSFKEEYLDKLPVPNQGAEVAA